MVGGQIVDEIDGNGAKVTGFIYAGGQPIARYQSTQLLWMNRDPLNTRERLSSSTGALSGGAEYDPSHSSVGMNDPGPSGDGTDPGLMYPRNGDPTDLSGGCMIDFGVAPCSVAMNVVNGGAGVVTDPYEKSSTKWNPEANGGAGEFQIFHVFADGTFGYAPLNAVFGSNGFWHYPGSDSGGRLGQSNSDSPDLPIGQLTLQRILALIDPCVSGVVATTPARMRDAAWESVPLLLQNSRDAGLSLAQTAYVLPTVRHESSMGATMIEFASGQAYEGNIRLGNTESGDGSLYKGRGYVQVTGRANYQYWSDRLGSDLVGNPDLATDPEIAATIAVLGMTDGTFTGKALDRYINSRRTDFFNARKTVNGLDRAGSIARYARNYFRVLSRNGC